MDHIERIDEKMEDLKMQMLKDRVQRAKAEIEAGSTTGGDPFFDELLIECLPGQLQGIQ